MNVLFATLTDRNENPGFIVGLFYFLCAVVSVRLFYFLILGRLLNSRDSSSNK